jgi:superoxide dismutase, Cu-Zn family
MAFLPAVCHRPAFEGKTAMQKLGINCSVTALLAVLGLAACGGSQPEPQTPAAAEAPPEPASPAPVETTSTSAANAKTVAVTFESKSGSSLAGKGTLTETSEGVKVELALDHVSPGEHGAHVHEKGDCSAPDGASAGGHFNPASSPHALPAASPRHLGDLGNVTIDAEGKGTLEIVAPGANLKEGDPNSFVGRAIIVHEKKDDGGQPTGNAGGRIGCAVIK